MSVRVKWTNININKEWDLRTKRNCNAVMAHPKAKAGGLPRTTKFVPVDVSGFRRS
jgi:hypothetical protein